MLLLYRKAGVAGMLLDPEQPTTKIGDEMRNNATGSILIIEAETLAEARRIVEKDVYWKNGVVSCSVLDDTTLGSHDLMT